MTAQEALLYEKLDNQRVRCNLCAHRCLIAAGRKGTCLVRENRDGTLYTLVYGIPLSQAVDPIEKKPLFHVYPGTTSFSIATAGCNFRCDFCQNADISQMPRDRGEIRGYPAAPEEVVRAAQKYGCRTIAYTYTEPTIFFEYSYDIARLAHPLDIASVYVTNGYMTPEMLDLFQGLDSPQRKPDRPPPEPNPCHCERSAGPEDTRGAAISPPLLDAANVDLKAFRDETYKRVCGARLQPVLDALVRMVELGIWVEVTTLVVPGLNDSEAELAEIAGFIAHHLGPQTPWHVSRFHPDYRMRDRGATPASTLRRAYDLGRQAGLHYVYVGNMPGAHLEDTLCPGCAAPVIRRRGFQVLDRALRDGACAHCGTAIHGLGL